MIDHGTNTTSEYPVPRSNELYRVANEKAEAILEKKIAGIKDTKYKGFKSKINLARYLKLTVLLICGTYNSNLCNYGENMGETITIRDAVVAVEKIRESTIISYMASQNALVGPEDAGMIVDTIEMVLPKTRKLDRLDLFLHSPGGFLDSAYKIIRICREYASEFNVIIPLAAKSAATVIALGAKEIVMTVFAELGPIDPIIQHPYKPDIRVPARSIKDFFEFLNSTETEKVLVDPQFKAQMSSLLDPYLIGSYQTALNSSKQIATKLLSENALKDHPDLIPEAVKKLTEHYYSHSYVIDRNEAREMGLNVINTESVEGLDFSVRRLLQVYQQFMMQNNILKVVGNREQNRNIQPYPIAQLPPQQKPVNLVY